VGAIHNEEYGVDISKGLPKISDYGNIQITGAENPPTLKDFHEKLATKVAACVGRKNVAFVIGGSRDLFGAVADGVLREPKKTAFVSINHVLDLKPLMEFGIPHQESATRYLFGKMKEEDKLIEFGLSGY